MGATLLPEAPLFIKKAITSWGDFKLIQSYPIQPQFAAPPPPPAALWLAPMSKWVGTPAPLSSAPPPAVGGCRSLAACPARGLSSASFDG
jgi:hypothetical protein